MLRLLRPALLLFAARSTETVNRICVRAMTTMAEKPRTGVNSLEDWSNKWREGVTGWHLNEVNPLLVKHFDRLIDGRQNVDVFVPLCGKSLDLRWIYDKGHRVIGLEFDAKVVEELFTESGIDIANVTKCGDLRLYSNVDQRFRVYQGDFFAFCSEFESEPYNAIWDRAALSAINLSDRQRYISIMKSVMSPSCRYLLATVEYDTSQYTGPPHAIAEGELKDLFAAHCPEINASDRAGVSFVERVDGLSERRKKWGLTRFEEAVYVIAWET